MNAIGVLGTGAWGLALAQAQARAGRTVTVWGRPGAAFDALKASRRSPRLAGRDLHPGIDLTDRLADVSRTTHALLVAVPSLAVPEVMAAMASACPGVVRVLCTKGFAPDGQLWSMALVGSAGPLAFLSGPSFALEVMDGKPTAVVIAAERADLAERLLACLAAPGLRPYASTDLVGVQVGGALKNVLAIACGIADGLGLGDNARAALVTRGLAELTRLGLALGGRAETFSGLAGLGDLLLTATSPQSRNYTLGYRLGQGVGLPEALRLSAGVAEGAAAAALAVRLAARLGVECPVTSSVDGVLHHAAPLETVDGDLLSRPLKFEIPAMNAGV